MDKQHQIKRTLSLPESIETIRQILGEWGERTRGAVGEAVCRCFGFFDAGGRTQTSSCVKALRELERAGHFALPAPRPRAEAAPRVPGPAVEIPQEVPDHVEGVRDLTLTLVETAEDRRLWNDLMSHEHPQGAGPLVGCQLRYLIGSAHGWLGGLGFGAAALQLADRDRWIGWDAPTRRNHLHRIVGMNRFLIRPSVACHNLASRVLGMVLRRLAGDFETRYHYRPWLVESFVDTEHYAGTCYRAANWIAVGRTRGRGRQDRYTKRNRSIKEIYLYPLDVVWRAHLGVPEPAAPRPLALAEGLEDESWAENEFGGAALGDRRLSQRLVDSVRIQATMPSRAFSGAAQGDFSAVKGYYRLIDQPDDSAVTPEAILAPHQRRTIQRMKAQATVLSIVDGTDLNFNGLAQCKGLGVIGTNQTSAKSRGLHLSSTLVVTPEGLPLGVLGAQFSAPQPKAKEASPAPAPVPVEQKKTFSWIQSLRHCIHVADELPETRQIVMTDREGDFFELFVQPRPRHRVELLIRAQHDRCTTEESRLFACVRESPVQGETRIRVPRQSARPKKSKQKVRSKQAMRWAEVVLRYREITIAPPATHPDKSPIAIWVIDLQETVPPPDVKPLAWTLLSTLPITTLEEAQECLRWYCLRWRIEDWHRVLKSGCRIEALAHQTAPRLQRAIAIHLVIAWRIMVMTLLGRECPELPPEVLFSDIEIEVLQAYAKKKSSHHPVTSATPRA